MKELFLISTIKTIKQQKFFGGIGIWQKRSTRIMYESLSNELLQKEVTTNSVESVNSLRANYAPKNHSFGGLYVSRNFKRILEKKVFIEINR